MDRYIFLGVGRYVVNVVEILEAQYSQENREGKFEIYGFIDSDQSKHGKQLHGYPVLGGVDWLKRQEGVYRVVSFVNPKARAELIREVVTFKNCIFPNVIHPSAIVSSKATVGQGVILAQNVVIAPFVTLGDFTHLNYSVTIGHDCVLGAYVTCNGGVHVAGSSIVENQVFIGPGAVVIDGVTVGKNAKVGANAVVRKNIPSGATAVGIPAKVL